MATDRLNFSTGGIVNPMTPLKDGLDGFNTAIGNISKSYLQQEALDKEQQRYDAQVQRQNSLDALQAERYKQADAHQAVQDQRQAVIDARNAETYDRQTAAYNKELAGNKAITSAYLNAGSNLDAAAVNDITALLSNYAESTERSIAPIQAKIDANKAEHEWVSDPTLFQKQSNELTKQQNEVDAFKERLAAVKDGTYTPVLTAEQKQAYISMNGQSMIRKIVSEAVEKGATVDQATALESNLKAQFHILSPSEQAAAAAAQEKSNLDGVSTIATAIKALNSQNDKHNIVINMGSGIGNTAPTDSSVSQNNGQVTLPDGFVKKHASPSTIYHTKGSVDSTDDMAFGIGSTSADTFEKTVGIVKTKYPNIPDDQVRQAVFTVASNRANNPRNPESGALQLKDNSELLANVVSSTIKPKPPFIPSNGVTPDVKQATSNLEARLIALSAPTNTLTLAGKNDVLASQVIGTHLPTIGTYTPEKVAPVKLGRDSLNNAVTNSSAEIYSNIPFSEDAVKVKVKMLQDRNIVDSNRARYMSEAALKGKNTIDIDRALALGTASGPMQTAKLLGSYMTNGLGLIGNSATAGMSQINEYLFNGASWEQAQEAASRGYWVDAAQNNMRELGRTYDIDARGVDSSKGPQVKDLTPNQTAEYYKIFHSQGTLASLEYLRNARR